MNIYMIILLTVIFFIDIIYAIDIKNKTIRNSSYCECPLEEVPSCTCRPNTKFIIPSTEMICSCLTEMFCNCMENFQKFKEQQTLQTSFLYPQLTTNTFSTTISPLYFSPPTQQTSTTNYDICTINCNKICIETCKTTPIHKQNVCYDICKNTCETSCQQPETIIYSTTYAPYSATTTPEYQIEYDTTLSSDTYKTQQNYPIYPTSFSSTASPTLFFDVKNQQNDCSLQCTEKCGENFPECISACQNICDCERSCKDRCLQMFSPIYSCISSCKNTCSNDRNIVINLHKFLDSRRIGISKLNKGIKKENKIKSLPSGCLIKCYQNCQINNTLEICSNYCSELCNCTDTCTDYCIENNIPNHQCEDACNNTCKANNKYNNDIKYFNSIRKVANSCDETCYNSCILLSKCDTLIAYNEKESCKYECKKKCKIECSNEEIVTKCANLGNDDKLCICPNGYRSCGNNNYCCLVR